MLISRHGRLGVAVGASLLVVLASGAILLNGQAQAASTSIKGRFSSQLVSGPSCGSPVALCTAGSLTGDLKGLFEFTATSLTPTVDTPVTGVLLYTGDITVHTKDGDLVVKDAGAFRSTGDGAVSSVATIIGGTSGLAGSTGTIQFVGTFTAAGGGAGAYTGTLMTP